MLSPFRASTALLAIAPALVLVLGAGCSATPPSAATASTEPTPIATATATPVRTSPPAARTAGAATQAPAAQDWPSPADCISYHPSSVTVRYDAGSFIVSDGSTQVVRVPGQPGSDTGTKALALAQRFSRHCFLGRGNTREERNSYTFDYWRDASGRTPTIPGQEDDCSGYNNANLTVEDMGDGNGWRVKDHDHVLHLFDNESDARNGKLVLLKYHQICFIGDSSSDDPDLVSYFS